MSDCYDDYTPPEPSDDPDWDDWLADREDEEWEDA